MKAGKTKLIDLQFDSCIKITTGLSKNYTVTGFPYKLLLFYTNIKEATEVSSFSI